MRYGGFSEEEIKRMSFMKQHLYFCRTIEMLKRENGVKDADDPEDAPLLTNRREIASLFM